MSGHDLLTVILLPCKFGIETGNKDINIYQIIYHNIGQACNKPDANQDTNLEHQQHAD